MKISSLHFQEKQNLNLDHLKSLRSMTQGVMRDHRCALFVLGYMGASSTCHAPDFIPSEGKHDSCRIKEKRSDFLLKKSIHPSADFLTEFTAFPLKKPPINCDRKSPGLSFFSHEPLTRMRELRDLTEPGTVKTVIGT